jgi:hypothetical protein
VIERKDWKWYGHPGHFICARWCRFHLCTEIGPYVVSTVGEYWPGREVREIHADVVDPGWLMVNRSLKGDAFDSAYMKRFGFEEIGHDRTFETMVFRTARRCDSPECGCNMPIIDPSEIDFEPEKTAGEAASNHEALCVKWAAKEQEVAK